jgi:protein-disulfide isomerase
VKADEAKEVEPSEWKENLVAILVVCFVVFGAYAIFFTDWLSPEEVVVEEERRYEISTYNSYTLGDGAAPVTIVEFSDYQCPTCAWFHQNLFPRLQSEYIDTGKVRFVYRDFPLKTIHPEASVIAKAANCAGEQGAFWEFHHAFYENEIDEALISALILEHDLDEEKMILCRNSDAATLRVENDILGAINEGGVSATPTFFINGKKRVGSGTEEEFFAAIDAALNRDQ